jgi:hypothetical protein
VGEVTPRLALSTTVMTPALAGRARMAIAAQIALAAAVFVKSDICTSYNSRGKNLEVFGRSFFFSPGLNTQLVLLPEPSSPGLGVFRSLQRSSWQAILL